MFRKKPEKPVSNTMAARREKREKLLELRRERLPAELDRIRDKLKDAPDRFELFKKEHAEDVAAYKRTYVASAPSLQTTRGARRD